MGLSNIDRLLSSTEKLNDHNYRSPIHHAHPIESTSACPEITSGSSSNGKTKKKMKQQQQKKQVQSACLSVCTSLCSTSVLQQPRKDANDLIAMSTNSSCSTRYAHFMPTHCAPSTKNGEAAISKANATQSKRIRRHLRGTSGQRVSTQNLRMRGGGSGGQLDFFNCNSDFTWYNSRFTTIQTASVTRREGGGGSGETYPTIGCGKVMGKQRGSILKTNDDFLQFDSINPKYLASNKCKLRHMEENNENKPECSCPENDYLESVVRKKGQGMCIKKPCLGTDCLIKAFKDAQEFVDSIGKGPGLAGLGIIESPYFGHPQEKKQVTKKDPTTTSKQAEPISNLCNTQNLENLRKLSQNVTTNALTSTVTRKSGVVQEAITNFPDPSTHASLKAKKKDEKIEKPKETEIDPSFAQNIEDTPCGEPKCKSRPKKVSTETDDSEKINDKEKTVTQKSDKKQTKVRPYSGPSGERNQNSKAKSEKAKQFVYSFGNTYPTSVYGHKTCSLLRPRVPAHMGWMWNRTDEIGKIKPRAGWKPGAISVQLKEMLNEAKLGFFKEARRPRSAPTMTKKGKTAQKTMSFTAMKKGVMSKDEETEEDIEFPPTLHIHRKDGVYYVTMYPIRPETSDVPRLDEPINPLQFKIVKSKGSLATSSTASDMEIEFSPPAAVNRPKKKPNVVHVETQVMQQEIIEAVKMLNEPKRNSKTKKDKDKKK